MADQQILNYIASLSLHSTVGTFNQSTYFQKIAPCIKSGTSGATLIDHWKKNR